MPKTKLLAVWVVSLGRLDRSMIGVIEAGVAGFMGGL
jgi:hypothetical protein